MTSNKVMESMIQRIDASPKGKAFVLSDFADLGSYDAVKKAFSRLAAEGKLIRVHRGIYQKPNYNEFLQQDVALSPREVAEAIARAYGWHIVPSGEAALNQMGLSTQVPSVYEYVTDGPHKTIRHAQFVIKLKRRTNREISELSPKSALLIEAIKAIGKEDMNKDIRRKLMRKFSQAEKKKLLKEAQRTRSWVYEEIKNMTSEGDNHLTHSQ
ncbi:MAG: DUF6088 family protein [Bacillota bacterium]|nr:DUF6088 family protein [Bacillota bacterium]